MIVSRNRGARVALPLSLAVALCVTASCGDAGDAGTGPSASSTAPATSAASAPVVEAATATATTAEAAPASSSVPEPAAPQVGEPVVVGTAKFTNYNLSVGAGGPDGSRVAVMWNDYDGKRSVERPFLVVSDDGGTTFGAPVLLDEHDPYLAYPELAVDGEGAIYVAVTRYAEGDEDGWPALYVSEDGGATFAMRSELPDAPPVPFGYAGTQLAVSPDGGTVVMAWPSTAADGEGFVGLATVSTDGGRSFGVPQELGTVADNVMVRLRPFFAGDRPAVAVPYAVPIPDPPAATPANPNPAVSTPALGVTVADAAGTFGPLVDVPVAGALPRFDGPGAAAAADGSISLAWWEVGADDVTAMLATGDGSSFAEGTPALTVPGFADPATGDASAIELAVDGTGAAWVLLAPVADGTPGLQLVVAADGAAPVEVAGAAAPRFTSGVEYDIAALPDGAVIAWLDGKDVKVRTVTR